MKNRIRLFSLVTLFFLILLGLDRWMKLWTIDNLKGQPSYILWKGVFQLTYAENVGAAFSLLENKQWFFVLAAAVISFFLILSLIRVIRSSLFSWEKPVCRIYCFLAPMVLAGALGNMMDRLIYGYVIDTFDFVLIHYPIFNLADSYIVIAVIAFAVLVVFRKGYFEELEALMARPKEPYDG